MYRVRFNLKEKIMLLSLGLLLAYNLLPFLPLFLPNAVRYPILIVIRFLPVLLIIIFPENKKNVEEIVVRIFLSLTIMVMLYFGKWQYSISFTSFFSSHCYFFELFIVSAAIKYYSDDFKRKLRFFCLFLFMVTSITTIVGLQMYPTAMRQLSGAVSEETSRIYTRMNIGGYSFVYGVLFVIPLILHLFRKADPKNKKLKIFYILVIILLSFLIIMSQYTTALLCLVLLFGLNGILKIENSSKMAILIFAIISIGIIAIINVDNLIQIGVNFASKYKLIRVEERMRELQILNDEKVWTGDIEGRKSLYSASFNSFLHHPILGNILFGRAQIGGHSDLLDFLAVCGLFGGWLLLKIAERIRIKPKDRSEKTYFGIILILFLIILSINTVFNSVPIGIAIFLMPVLSDASADYLHSINTMIGGKEN